MKYLVTTVKGLEEISKREIIDKLPEAVIEKVSTKRIIFEYNEEIDNLKKLRTVDDVDFLLELSPDFQLQTASLIRVKLALVKVRSIKSVFSLTVSQSKPGIDTAKVKADLIKQIEQKLQFKFIDEGHDNCDFRLFIHESEISLSVRVFQEPLHHRDYKTDSLPGSLKPSIAASMVYILSSKSLSGEVADVQVDRVTEIKKLIDLFCGSGTILAEAYLEGFDVYGSDMDPRAVETTRQNLANLKAKNLDNQIKKFEVNNTKWPKETYDLWISNLPWDKQIRVNSLTEIYRSGLKEAKRILKSDGKLCVLIHNGELFLSLAKKIFPDKVFKSLEISYMGQKLSIIYSI